MDSNYDPTAGAIGAVVGLAIGAIYLLLVVGGYVLMSIALMQFFRKVGVEPWAAWVPFYNYWKWLEAGGQPGWLAVLLVVPYAGIVTTVFLLIGMYRTGIAFGKDGSWVVLGLFLPFVWCFLLARQTEFYDPARIVAAGYPPPRAGFGSVPPGWAPPPAPPAA